MTAPRPRAPRGCYWRGNVLWGRMKVGQKLRKWSLRTGDPVVAAQRRWAARWPVDPGELKAKIAGLDRLTDFEKAVLVDALDAAVVRTRQGGGHKSVDDT